MKLSIVDISPIPPGTSRHGAFQNSIRLAQHAERLGYHRYWVAEHHGGSIGAGRAPETLIAAIGANTERIRLGSGSVLLNHYSPFKVAELFCTLNELYPGRIDLGAGRATTGPVTDFALQQERSRVVQSDSGAQLSELVTWLEGSFPSDHPFATAPLHTDAIPDLYLLGSSAWSARAAAQLGLPYVFAGFINQRETATNIGLYRKHFQPSTRTGPRGTGVDKPWVMLAVHVVCADTTDEARRQLAPVHVMYHNFIKGNLTAPLLSPDDAIRAWGTLPDLDPYPGGGIPPKFIGGTPDEVKATLDALVRDLEVDELMIQDVMTDQQARLRSYELLAELF